MSRVSSRTIATNCTLEIPGGASSGTYKLVVDRLGYGMNVVMSEGRTRRKKVFYPDVRTSGTWYINAVFGNYEDQKRFHDWLLLYVARITNPNAPPVKPITVKVPSENFIKVGYPTSTISYGQSYTDVLYESVVGFSSASDPALYSAYGSNYRAPTGDSEARNFYPAGVQSASIPDPIPLLDVSGPNDDVWAGSSLGYGGWRPPWWPGS